MSIFSELLPKINNISSSLVKNFEEDLKVAFDCFEKFEEEFQNGRNRAREKTQKDKNAINSLQSIIEDEVEQTCPPVKSPKANNTNKRSSSSSGNSDKNTQKRNSKKRSKNEVDGLSSPEQDKRQKRNASVKAQTIISKQVNVNLIQKMRRGTSNEMANKNQSQQAKRQKDDEKENLQPNKVPLLQVKLEKLSLPLEEQPMETESLPLNIQIKQELHKDDIAMPPPAGPIPKPRKMVAKEIVQSEESGEEETQGRRRTTRTKKQVEAMPPPPVPSARSTRASSRVRQTYTEETQGQPPAETRPKRTRTKKKQSEVSTVEVETDVTQVTHDSGPPSLSEKPRPKRTRRGQKAVEKEEQKLVESDSAHISTNEEENAQPTVLSPILSQKLIKLKNKKDQNNHDTEMQKGKELTKNNSVKKALDQTKNSDKELKKTNSTEKELTKTNSIEKELIKTNSIEKELTKTNSIEKEIAKANSTEQLSKIKGTEKVLTKTKNGLKELQKSKSFEKSVEETDKVDNAELEETKIITNMDQTVVLPNGVYNHAPVTPKNIKIMNETVVLHNNINRETIVLEKPQKRDMDATVIIENAKLSAPLTEDNSLLTDDSDVDNTPPKKGILTHQPTSAVKEKVQQFEELATRVTRTKTRAMAKKEDQPETLTTPPDKVSKTVLSSETLTKMNSLIFNGKQTQISSSASKPRAAVVVTKLQPASTSKLSAINKAKEAAEESLKKEDARKKKEALLEAKREQQRKKREEKVLAAAAARTAAEKERQKVLAAMEKERREKNAHLTQEKAERMREAERKKLEVSRKAAETEERRRADEAARRQRLADEQRRAADLRRKLQLEHDAMKKEAAIIAKEIEQKQKLYNEKQKKQKMEEKMHTPFKTPGTPNRFATALEPVYMQDGFQYLIPDEDLEPPDIPVPEWSTSKVRLAALGVQSGVRAALVERLFSVRVHSPDLRDLFPHIERARLKRTSSAVWRTPPAHR